MPLIFNLMESVGSLQTSHSSLVSALGEDWNICLPEVGGLQVLLCALYAYCSIYYIFCNFNLFFSWGHILKLHTCSDRMYVNTFSSVSKCWKLPSLNALSWENKSGIPGQTWTFLLLSILVIRLYCLSRFLCLHLYFADKSHEDMVKGTDICCKPACHLSSAQILAITQLVLRPDICWKHHP